MKIAQTPRIKMLRAFLMLNGILLFFWWPLSHWLYSDLYHRVMGFGAVDAYDSFIKIIGTCGIIPVLLMLFSAKDPLRHRTEIITLIIFGFLLSATFGYLTFQGFLPVNEYFNAGLCFISSLFLLLAYPWKYQSYCPSGNSFSKKKQTRLSAHQ